MMQLVSVERLKAVYAFLFGGIAFFIWDQFAHWVFESVGLDKWYNYRFLYDPGVPPCGALNFVIIAGLVGYAFRTGRRLLGLSLVIPTVFSVVVLYLSLGQYIFRNL